MSLTPAQLRARFSWEAACERLRDAIPPHSDLSETDVRELESGLALVRQCYGPLCEAFGIEAIALVPAPGLMPLRRLRRILRATWRRLKTLIEPD